MHVAPHLDEHANVRWPGREFTQDVCRQLRRQLHVGYRVRQSLAVIVAGEGVSDPRLFTGNPIKRKEEVNLTRFTRQPLRDSRHSPANPTLL